jgi:hypothetical protein
VEITQVAVIAMAAEMRVDELARVPLSYATYTDILALVAVEATEAPHTTTRTYVGVSDRSAIGEVGGVRVPPWRLMEC